MDEKKDAGKRTISRIAKQIVLNAPDKINDNTDDFVRMVERVYPGEISDYEALRAECAVQHARVVKFLFPDGKAN